MAPMQQHDRQQPLLLQRLHGSCEKLLPLLTYEQVLVGLIVIY